MAQALTPFPWEALDHLSRAEAKASGRARRWLARSIDLGRLADVAVDLLGAPVELQLRGVTLAPRRPASDVVVITLAAEGATTVVLELEPPLAARLAARICARELPWLDPARPAPPEVAGAAAAFAVALARRAGDVPWRLAGSPPEGATLYASFVVLLGDEVFAAGCTVALGSLDPPALRFDARALVGLGDVPLSLPLVAATSLATRAELASLAIGAAWAPGGGWTIRRRADGATPDVACLVAPRSEEGLAVRVERAPSSAAESGTLLGGPASIVLTAGLAPAPWEGSHVTETTTDTASPHEPLGDADIVVRVEVATVTLPARRWAEIAPGDVIATGVRLGETVTLRAGGVAFARGELCDVEGELAVRIVERAGAAP